MDILHSSGFNHRHIVIVGTGEQAAVVADRLRRSTWFGLEISALYGIGTEKLPFWLRGKRFISDVTELRRYVDDGALIRYGFLYHTVRRRLFEKL